MSTIRRTATGNRAAGQLGRAQKDLLELVRGKYTGKQLDLAAGRVATAWVRLVNVERTAARRS